MTRSSTVEDDEAIEEPSQPKSKKSKPADEVKESEDEVEHGEETKDDEEDDYCTEGDDEEPYNELPLDSITPIKPVSVITLTEPGHPGLLDCPICYEPLTTPIFQCDNHGHLVCSSCQSQILRCPLCSGPFGSKRCRVIEKILESSTTSCQYNQFPPVKVITLKEPTLLDCSICKEPLSIPVFQCDDHNDHSACSSCSSRILKYRSARRCSFLRRCRIIETILESSTTLCRNSIYGCKEVMTSTSKDHEKACMLSPCTCPHSGCNFVSSARSLYKHFKRNHEKFAKRFVYDGRFSVRIVKNINTFLVLQEKSEGTLFTFENNLDEIAGNVLRVTCIQPWFKKGAPFELVAEKDEGNSVKIKAFTKSNPSPGNDAPTSSYSYPSAYLIPSDFFDSNDRLKIDLCISKPDHTVSPGSELHLIKLLNCSSPEISFYSLFSPIKF